METQMVEDIRVHGVETASKVDNDTIVDYDDQQGYVKVNCTETRTIEDVGYHNGYRTEEVDENASVVDVDKSFKNLDKSRAQGEDLISFVGIGNGISINETVVITRTKFKNEESNENHVKNEDSKDPHDAVFTASHSNNQVSEADPTLGFQVNDSISSDSITIDKQNVLKDSLNANVPPKCGVFHPLDEPSPCELDDTHNGGSSEKLNLDQSPGDDLMEEDVLESKNMDSHHISVGVEDDKKEMHFVKEGISFDSSDSDVSNDKNISTKGYKSEAAPKFWFLRKCYVWVDSTFWTSLVKTEKTRMLTGMQMGFAPPTFLLNIDEVPNGILMQPHGRYFWKMALCGKLKDLFVTCALDSCVTGFNYNFICAKSLNLYFGNNKST
ncbi:hypothetical protein MKX03_018766 [Papaver bracteatum]|nr:hypothetical protein MKX03_018766 [Papaver bracteatum]